MSKGSKALVLSFIGSLIANCVQVYIGLPLYKKFLVQKIEIKGEILDTQSRTVDGIVVLYSASPISMTKSEDGRFEFVDIPLENSYLIKVTNGPPAKQKWYTTPTPKDRAIDFTLLDFPADLCTLRGYISSSSPHKPIPKYIEIWAGDTEGSISHLSNTCCKYEILSIPPPSLQLMAKDRGKVLYKKDICFYPHEPKVEEIVVSTN